MRPLAILCQPIDFSHAFLVVATFTLVAAPVALFMRRDAGTTETGRRWQCSRCAVR